MSDEMGWKPPVKGSAAEGFRKQRDLVRTLLQLETEELFIGALRVLGMNDGSPEWSEALEAWRAHQRTRY